MLPYEFYKVLHVLGIGLLLFALGGAYRGYDNPAQRKPLAIIHGIAMFFLLLAGFGLLARLGIHWPWPGWVWIKVVSWLMFGVSMALIKRGRLKGGPLLIFSIFWLLLASYFAVWKPF